MEDLKIKELAELLDITKEEAKQKIDNGDYLVLTEEEADEKTAEYIKESAWAFNTSFIISHSKVKDIESNWLYEQAEKSLQKLQENECEGANDLILAMIEDIDEFIEDAIACDGRGHFLASYDGEELETEHFLVYRVN